MPPATLPSNPSDTRRRSAFETSSSQCVERRALFAVTTCFPFSIAARMRVRAGSIPPMSSTTTCTSGSFTTSYASVVKTPGARPTFSARVASRSAARVSSNGTPRRRSISAPFLRRISTVPAPMFPSPRMPTLIALISPMRSPPEAPCCTTGIAAGIPRPRSGTGAVPSRDRRVGESGARRILSGAGAFEPGEEKPMRPSRSPCSPPSSPPTPRVPTPRRRSPPDGPLLGRGRGRVGPRAAHVRAPRADACPRRARAALPPALPQPVGAARRGGRVGRRPRRRGRAARRAREARLRRGAVRRADH